MRARKAEDELTLFRAIRLRIAWYILPKYWRKCLYTGQAVKDVGTLFKSIFDDMKITDKEVE